MTTTLYVLRDIHGAPVYVGVSDKPWTRMDQHRAREWWNTVASSTFTHYAHRGEAERAELTLITALRPPMNKAGQPSVPLPPRRHAVRPAPAVEAVPSLEPPPPVWGESDAPIALDCAPDDPPCSDATCPVHWRPGSEDWCGGVWRDNCGRWKGGAMCRYHLPTYCPAVPGHPIAPPGSDIHWASPFAIGTFGSIKPNTFAPPPLEQLLSLVAG